MNTGGRVIRNRKARVEVGDRMRGTSVAGVRLGHELANRIGLAREIDAHVHVLQMHLPYHESDHVLAMAFNLLAGGTCIEDLEHRRNDEALLDILDATRIPDPTTAGDFCRRFDSKDAIDRLQHAINESRLRVWQRQSSSFFDHAFVDADGTIAETTGSCKEGMDLSFKGTWGYQALHITLAKTEEVLFQDLRQGSRPSHEGAADRLDEAVALLRRGGFRAITLRGDTDFSQTRHLDRWHDTEVRFVFGYVAASNLRERADSLPEAAWKPFERKKQYTVRTQPRTRPRNVKEDIVMERELYNLHLCMEEVAEFAYRPSACQRAYRMVVLRKLITHERGQKILFPEIRYLFYITNLQDKSAAEIVETANQRCNQERTIGELKSGVNALGMPLGDLHSNWAYTVIATLAWNLSRWVGLVLPASGRWTKKHAEEKVRVSKMRFRTFVQALMVMPGQVLRTARQMVIRLLDWNPYRHVFFRALGAVRVIT
jgi:hypothetical protein